MTNMVPVPICGRQDWTILMPAERAARVQWPWHEWNRFHSMFHNLRPGDVLFDIGAEQGDQSALYQRWIQRPRWAGELIPGLAHPYTEHEKREGGIVLIEPNPVGWANIKAVWEANGLRHPLGCVEAFVGREERNDPVGHEDWPPSAAFQMAKYVGTASISPDSPITTIDELSSARDHACGAGEWMAAVPPDAITMDIEGGELDALRGAMGVLTLDKPLVWVSIHWDLLLERGQSRDELIDYMAGLGYRHEHLGADHEQHALFWHPEGRTPVLPYDGVGGS